MESKYSIITAGEFKLLFAMICLNRKNLIGAETDFWLPGMLATLGASASCEGGLKFLCRSQPETRDGSHQEEARRAGLEMQERYPFGDY